MKISPTWAIPIAIVGGLALYTQKTTGKFFPISIKPATEPITRLIEVGYGQWQDKGPTEFSPSNLGAGLKNRVFGRGDSELDAEDVDTPIDYGVTDEGCVEVFEGQPFVDLNKFQHHLDFFANPTKETLSAVGINPFCKSEDGLIYVDAADTTKRQKVKIEEGGRVILVNDQE